MALQRSNSMKPYERTRRPFDTIYENIPDPPEQTTSYFTRNGPGRAPIGVPGPGRNTHHLERNTRLTRSDATSNRSHGTPSTNQSVNGSAEATKGFPLQIVEGPVNPAFVCGLCKRILREPFQNGRCGHRFCRLCIENYIYAVGEYETCPRESCEANIRAIEDNSIRRDLEELVVQCASEGCFWSGTLEQYPKHEADCADGLACMSCPACYKVHRQRDMVANKSGAICQRCCDAMAKTPQPSLDAIDSVPTPIQQYSPGRQKQTPETADTCNKIDTDDSPSRLPVKDDIISWKYASNQIRRKMEKKMRPKIICPNGCRKMMYPSEWQHHLSTDCKSNKGLPQGSQRVEKMADAWKSASDSKSPAGGRLWGGELDTGNDYKHLARPGSEAAVTDNGELTWTIQDFDRQIKTAKCNRRSCLWSEPFNTRTHGYKLQVQLYPYGQGDGRRNHASLYLVIIRGKHDESLYWPFPHKWTATLYDQLEFRHVKRTWTPGESPSDSPALQRPRREKNEGFGWSQFVSIADLTDAKKGHIVKDTIVFHIQVERKSC